MKTHPMLIVLDDEDWLLMQRAKLLARRMFELQGMPTYSQTVSWMLNSIPWEELDHARGENVTKVDTDTKGGIVRRGESASTDGV